MTASPITGYSSQYQFNLVNYTSSTTLVQRYEQQNWERLDGVLTNLMPLISVALWQPNTTYIVGNRATDTSTGAVYYCRVPHTSSNNTFASDRQYNPTYWAAISTPLTYVDIASNIQFTPPGGSAASIVNKLNLTIDLRTYPGVDPTGTNDSTAAIQLAINQAAATGMPATIICNAGTYAFTTLYIASPRITLRGEGEATIFLQISAAGNGIVIGNPGGVGYAGATITNGVAIKDITFDTKHGVIKTGGAMILAYYTNNLILSNIHIGTQLLDVSNPQHHSWNAIVIAGFTQCLCRDIEVWNAANDGFTVYALPNTPQGSPGTDYAAELHFSGQINVCGHIGIHISGGVGGAYFESGGQARAVYGVYIDVALSPNAILNEQITFGQHFAVDTNSADGVIAAASSIGDLFFKSWSSSNTGCGLRILGPQANGRTTISAGHFENNGSHAIVILGGRFIISGGTDAYGNGTTSPGGSGIFIGGSSIGGLISDVSLVNNGIGGAAGFGIDEEGPANTTVIGPVYYSGNQQGNYRTINGLGTLVIASPH